MQIFERFRRGRNRRSAQCDNSSSRWLIVIGDVDIIQETIIFHTSLSDTINSKDNQLQQHRLKAE